MKKINVLVSAILLTVSVNSFAFVSVRSGANFETCTVTCKGVGAGNPDLGKSIPGYSGPCSSMPADGGCPKGSAKSVVSRQKQSIQNQAAKSFGKPADR